MIKDTGSNYNFGVQSPKAIIPKSNFDLSYVNSFSCKEGVCTPCWTQHTVPTDMLKIKNEALIRVTNIPRVPLSSRQRAFFHTYWNSLSDLWKFANVFFPKGRTTSDWNDLKDMVVPKVTLSKKCVQRGSLVDHLGFNFADYEKLPDIVSIPAFKPMMYLRLMRDNYINQRIFASWLDYCLSHPDASPSGVDITKVKAFLFPKDDGDFRIGSSQWDDLLTSQPTVDWLFGSCWYRDWTQDYFTTSLTSPEIEEPEINVGTGYFVPKDDVNFSGSYGVSNLGVTTFNGKNYLSGNDIQLNGSSSPKPFNNNVSFKLFVDSTSQPRSLKTRYSDQGGNHDEALAWINQTSTGTHNAAFVEALNNTMEIFSNNRVTMDNIRNLACASAILHKLACTNGSYGAYTRAYFGITSSSAVDHKAKYIGGSYQSIVYTDVVNTASSQGDVTGKGISASQNDVGSFFCDDYGICMTIFSVMPDTYYNQGWNREDLYETSDDFYLPERAKLGMDAILNGEIYYQGIDSTDTNKQVFGYQNRFDYMRYRYNETHGAVAETSSNNGFHELIQQRVFKNLPSLTPSFLTTSGNIDKSWATVIDGHIDDFFVQVNNQCLALRPLPYKAEENNLGF